MGPFFAASNIGSSTSSNEIEQLAEGLTASQRDGIADIIYEAYGEDIYSYLQVPPGSQNMDAAMVSGEGSAFLALMAPIAHADGSRLSRTQRTIRERLAIAQAAHETEISGTGKTGDPSTAQQPSFAPSVEVWPNPASDIVHIRVPEFVIGPLMVYDLRGRHVATIETPSTPTERVVIWEPQSAAGGRMPPGLYRMIAPGRGGTRFVSSVVIL